MRPILLVVLVLLLLGSGPWYSYSRDWGYMPISTLLVILLLIWLALTYTSGGPVLPRQAL